MDKDKPIANELIVDAVYRKMLKEFQPTIQSTPGRKRPRNPQERETLLRWERERDGDEIGKI